jgi:hypothetical protein
MLHPEQHPAAVDVGQLEACHFSRTQAGGIGGRQGDAMVQLRHCGKKAFHFLGTEHHRQLTRLAGVGDPLQHIAPPQCGAVEEP